MVKSRWRGRSSSGHGESGTGNLELTLPFGTIEVRPVRSSHLKSWNFAQNVHQTILVVSTLLGSWLGMQAVHEAGHALGALLTGGEIATVVLHPLTISHTEMIDNPHPLVVVWRGPWWVSRCRSCSGACSRSRGCLANLCAVLRWVLSDRQRRLPRGRLVLRRRRLWGDAPAGFARLGPESVRCSGRTDWLLVLEPDRVRTSDWGRPGEGQPSGGLRQPGDLLAPGAPGTDRGRGIRYPRGVSLRQLVTIGCRGVPKR